MGLFDSAVKGFNVLTNAAGDVQKNIESGVNSVKEWATGESSAPALLQPNPIIKETIKAIENYDFRLILKIKNLTDETKNLKFDHLQIVKEDNGATYSVETKTPEIKLESGIEKSINFSSTLPTDLDSHYYFTVDFSNVRYKVRLYETPDAERPDVTVTYTVVKQIVNKVTVKKGRPLGIDYVLEKADHLSFVLSWTDSNYQTINSKTIIEQDTTVYGEYQSSLSYSTTSLDAYTVISKVNYVPSDGIVVVPERLLDKEIVLGNYAVNRIEKMQKIYLPSTLHGIYNSNFIDCPDLRTIYFAGTPEQWSSIYQSTTPLPTNINLICNTSFSGGW